MTTELMSAPPAESQESAEELSPVFEPVIRLLARLRSMEPPAERPLIVRNRQMAQLKRYLNHRQEEAEATHGNRK
jgi:hypothetical protein